MRPPKGSLLIMEPYPTYIEFELAFSALGVKAKKVMRN